ncbi:MAG: peptidyl-prolyl cis-trans isomerase, partial [Acidobacteriales bacterium]|nr:peptidyl-prolyl cis-trans isomerase [Terriglobales bacterium]
PSAQQPGAVEDHSHHGAPATPAAPGQAPAAGAPAKPVAPTAPVITLNGYCEAPAAASAPAAKPASRNCKKVITKADFERILSAAIPANRRADLLANPQIKQQIARQYAEIMVMANEARKRGIQRRPATQEMMRINQLQVLAQGLMQDLSEQSTPSPAEVDKYYSENKAAFEEAIIRRLMVPKPTPPAATTPAASGSEAKTAEPAPPQPAPDEAAQKAYVAKARERAVAGEDFDKIQSDAFLLYKSTLAPPTTVLGPRRRGSLPPDHDAAVFALKPGEVSQWFDTPNGSYLYKVESKRIVPLGEVREEITRRLQPQKLNDSRTAIMNAVQTDLNQDYFGAAAPAVPPQAALEGAPTRRPSAQNPAARAHQPAPAQPQQPATQPK